MFLIRSTNPKISVRISGRIIVEFRATVNMILNKNGRHLFIIRYVYVHRTCVSNSYNCVLYSYVACVFLSSALDCERPYFCCSDYMKRARFLEHHSHWWKMKQNKIRTCAFQSKIWNNSSFFVIHRARLFLSTFSSYA